MIFPHQYMKKTTIGMIGMLLEGVGRTHDAHLQQLRLLGLLARIVALACDCFLWHCEKTLWVRMRKDVGKRRNSVGATQRVRQRDNFREAIPTAMLDPPGPENVAAYLKDFVKGRRGGINVADVGKNTMCGKYMGVQVDEIRNTEKQTQCGSSDSCAGY